MVVDNNSIILNLLFLKIFAESSKQSDGSVTNTGAEKYDHVITIDLMN